MECLTGVQRVLESAWEIRGLHTEKLSSGRTVSPSNTRLPKIIQCYYHITVDFAKAVSQNGANTTRQMILFHECSMKKEEN
jgi:hypothetical protein